MDPATPKPGETGTPKAPENVTPPSAPVQGNVDAGEVEKLRQENERLKTQADLRERQIANEKKAEEDRKAAEEAKRLEDNNEYKTLHEQEKAKREALEAELNAEEQRKEIAKTKTDVSKDYPDEVKSEAEELGITLDSTDDASVAAYKEKLDKLQKMAGTNRKVGPNNPGVRTNKETLTGPDLAKALKDPNKFQEYVSQRPGIAVMMAPQNRS
jgi:membrane protein involved in colicin uptake